MPTDDLWQLISAHRERLYRIARRRTPNRQDAEDVVQEAMLRAAAFDALDPERLGQLLTSVTVRLCVDLARRRAVEMAALPDLYVPPDDLEEAVLDADEAHFLASVPLTRDERTLLTARLHGLYPSEVAAGLGMTVAAAKAALRRARLKILAAWRMTLGLLGVAFVRRRSRDVAPAAAGTAAAVVLLTAVSVPLALYGPPELDHALRVVDGGLMTPADNTTPVPPDGSAHLSARAGPPQRVAAVDPATSSKAPDVRVAPLDVGDGAAGHRGVGVDVDDEEPLEERLARCVRNGIEVDVGKANVVCRE